jgi:hypothetical protein
MKAIQIEAYSARGARATEVATNCTKDQRPRSAPQNAPVPWLWQIVGQPGNYRATPVATADYRLALSTTAKLHEARPAWEWASERLWSGLMDLDPELTRLADTAWIVLA